MPKTLDTILTITILVCMGLLLLYGHCEIKKLDKTKDANTVSSSIAKHINHGTSPETVPDNPPASEDDGVTEDDDFEEYEEESDEDVFIEPAEEVAIPAPVPAPVTVEAKYLIIAGSFKSRSNAESKVEQLKKMGVSSEVVRLANSDLFSVCIAKSETEQKANDASSKLLVHHKIKSYVYKVPE